MFAGSLLSSFWTRSLYMLLFLCPILLPSSAAHAVTEHPVIFFNGIVRLVLPSSGFSPLPPDLQRKKFPYLTPKQPVSILANQDTSICVGVSWTDIPFSEDIATARTALSQQFRKSIEDTRWFKDELIAIDDHFFIHYSFFHSTKDAPSLTHFLITSYQGRMLIIFITAAGSQRTAWLDQGERLLRTITIGR